MKKKHLEYMTVVLLVLVSFFVGRESKTVSYQDRLIYEVERNNDSIDKNEFQPLYLENDLLNLSNTVFVCNGKSSKRYHFKKNCRGLSNCRSSISEVSIEEAKKRGRTLCGWED